MSSSPNRQLSRLSHRYLPYPPSRLKTSTFSSNPVLTLTPTVFHHKSSYLRSHSTELITPPSSPGSVIAGSVNNSSFSDSSPKSAIDIADNLTRSTTTRSSPLQLQANPSSHLNNQKVKQSKMRSAPADGQPKEVFTCSDCSQTYSRLEYLRRHQRKHDDVRPFACDLCPKKFARSDVLLRHKRRCHLDGEGDISSTGIDNADTDAATTLALAAAAAAASSTNPGRRERQSTGGTRGRGGKRPMDDRAPSSGSPSGSQSPENDPPSKIRRLGWDLEGVDEYARQDVGRGFGSGGGGAYNIDPRLTHVVDQRLTEEMLLTRQLAESGERLSSSGSSLTPDGGLSRYPGSAKVGGKYGGGYAQFHAQSQQQYETPGSERYDRSSAGAGSSTIQSPPFNYRADDHGRQMGFGNMTRFDESAEVRGSPSQYYFPLEGIQASQGYGNEMGRPEYDYRPATGTRTDRHDETGNIPLPNSASVKQNSGVDMEDATTLLAMAYGGFSQWDQQTGKSDIVNALTEAARRASDSEAQKGTTAIEAAHRLSVHSAGSVAGLTVVPDWQPGQQSAGFVLPQPAQTSGWTGGRPDGMGSDGTPFQTTNAAQTVVSLGALVDNGPISNAAKDASPSLYGGNWVAPDVLTPGPFAGMDFAKMSQVVSDVWGNYDSLQSPGIPSMVSSPFQFSTFFNTTPGFDDDVTIAAETDGHALCHLPGSAPQLTNHNPERPLLRIQSEGIYRSYGPETDQSDRFYLPPERIASCYTIPHWRMPPFAVLKRIARQTVSQLLVHLPLVHLPTFSMREIPVGLAFAMCVVGNPKNSSIARETIFGSCDGPTPDQNDRVEWIMGRGVLRPDPPGCCCVCPGDELSAKEEEDFNERRKMISVEKSGMIAQIITRAKGQHMSSYSVGLMQALLLLAAPLLLAPQVSQRQEGYIRVGVVINSARHLDMLENSEKHFQLYSSLTTSDGYFSINDAMLEAAWREWVRQETNRRLVWMLYMFDTLCALESGIHTSIKARELATLPLPAPDTLWKAQSAAEWNQALTVYQPATLQDCMEGLFHVKAWTTYGAPASGVDTATPDQGCILNRTDFGMFARYMMISTLLRGLLDIGQGKRTTGDWRAVTSLWTKEVTNHTSAGLGASHVQLTLSELLDLYGVALQRWRRGWDFDPLCDAPAAEALKYQALAKKDAEEKAAAEVGTPDLTGGAKTKKGARKDSANTESSGAGSSGMVATPDGNDHVLEVMNKPRKGIMFFEEALPLYWLSQALHSILVADKTVAATARDRAGMVPRCPEAKISAGVNRLAGIDISKMLQSARIFTRLGEGITTPSG